MQYSEQQIKQKVQTLYQKSPTILMNVIIAKPKRTLLKDALARIVGVYSHFFQIEETSTGKTELHTILYSDLIIGQVEIPELGL